MIVLFVWGFILPPMGTIDQSLIQAGGLLLALATIAQLPHIIETIGENRTLKLSKGDFTIETSKNKNI